jgi:AcrR family transcriptional regulator
MKPSDATPTEAARRIIDAAGQVFANHGFKGATVREICKRAGVNVAAVNYYFGDKTNLYMTVLKDQQVLAFERYPLDSGTSISPEARLKTFIQGLVFRMSSGTGSSILTKLMTREFVEPTFALDMIVETVARPSFQVLSAIVRQLLGDETNDEKVRLCCASIVSQCIYFHYARPVLARLFGIQGFADEELQRIADHVTRFSLHAIRQLAKEKGGM